MPRRLCLHKLNLSGAASCHPLAAVLQDGLRDWFCAYVFQMVESRQPQRRRNVRDYWNSQSATGTTDVSSITEIARREADNINPYLVARLERSSCRQRTAVSDLPDHDHRQYADMMAAHLILYSADEQQLFEDDPDAGAIRSSIFGLDRNLLTASLDHCLWFGDDELRNARAIPSVSRATEQYSSSASDAVRCEATTKAARSCRIRFRYRQAKAKDA